MQGPCGALGNLMWFGFPCWEFVAVKCCTHNMSQSLTLLHRKCLKIHNMGLTEPCGVPENPRYDFLSASTEAEKSFKSGRKIRCDPQMRRDGWRDGWTMNLWFPSHTTEPHRCCGEDSEEEDNSEHLFVIEICKGWSCPIHGLVQRLSCSGALLGHRGSNAPSCRALLQGLLLLWGLLNVNLTQEELLGVDFVVVFLSPQHFLHLWCFQHVGSELWNVISGIAALMHIFLWILACIYLWNAFFFLFRWWTRCLRLF